MCGAAAISAHVYRTVEECIAGEAVHYVPMPTDGAHPVVGPSHLMPRLHPYPISVLKRSPPNFGIVTSVTSCKLLAVELEGHILHQMQIGTRLTRRIATRPSPDTFSLESVLLLVDDLASSNLAS